jgi:hypothetical protein
VRNHAATLAHTALFLAALVAAAPREARAATAPPADPKAVAVADKVIQSLGGAEAWNNLRYLRFDFAVDRGGKTVVRRAHTWDKWTGQYRLEATSKEGEAFVVLMNVNTKEGSAFVKGKKVEGEALKKYLDQAYGAWVNDSYWLLMPYKMKDPGVIVAYDGAETKDGDTWDKVRLTFDNVGLTPKDKYWAFVNRKTGLVDRWDFVLNGENKPPSSFAWKNWKSYGKVTLADDRVSPDGTRIYFPVLETPESVPAATFTTP